jgi:hypothetical protein
MTQDEIDALPENGGFGQRPGIVNGEKVMIPFALPSFVLFIGEDDIIFKDHDGINWYTGTYNGARYKTRFL